MLAGEAHLHSESLLEEALLALLSLHLLALYGLDYALPPELHALLVVDVLLGTGGVEGVRLGGLGLRHFRRFLLEGGEEVLPLEQHEHLVAFVAAGKQEIDVR